MSDELFLWKDWFGRHLMGTPTAATSNKHEILNATMTYLSRRSFYCYERQKTIRHSAVTGLSAPVREHGIMWAAIISSLAVDSCIA
jgi:hypothetical protein